MKNKTIFGNRRRDDVKQLKQFEKKGESVYEWLSTLKWHDDRILNFLPERIWMNSELEHLKEARNSHQKLKWKSLTVAEGKQKQGE
jgi:hypothetical protein